MMPTTITPPIAAMVIRARRKVAAHFLAQHAVSPDEAVTFVPDRTIVRRQFERMRHKGVVRDGPGGTYWLDVAALRADDEGRRRVLIPVAIVVLLIAAAIPLFFYRG